MTLGDDISVVSVWNRRGHHRGHHIFAGVSPALYQCSSRVAAEADNALVCKKVAKMTHMHYDSLPNTLRLVFSAYSCNSATESRYRALAGKKGVVK